MWGTAEGGIVHSRPVIFVHYYIVPMPPLLFLVFLLK